VLQLKNKTPFQASLALFPDETGVDTLYVAVRGTLRILPAVELAEAQAPVPLADEYWGAPATTSLKYASESHLTKPSTDVALVGNAWAPGGQEHSELQVVLRVAERVHTVHVLGDRCWGNGGTPSSPVPFAQMPLTYERAFGGTHLVDAESGAILAEERNPVGVGFAGKRKASELEGLPLPNLEDPRQRLQRPGDLSPPIGFGFVAPSWLPRRNYAGTYDEGWQKNRAPYLPEDFDPRFFNAAHPALVFDRYLEGGEPVELLNACAEGPLRFTLPRCRLEVVARVAGSPVSPPVHLETVLLEPDENRLCLTWRAAIPCDKKALWVEQVDIGLLGLDLGGGPG